MFFEKLRIYQGEPKSENRRLNEGKHPNGFALLKKESKRRNKGGAKQSIKRVEDTKLNASVHEFC